ECYRRAETIVPQQALALVNSQLSIEQSRKLAQRISEELAQLRRMEDSSVRSSTQPTAENAPRTDESSVPQSSEEVTYVAALFQHVLCRPPSDEERTTCLAFLAEQSTRLADPKQLTPFPPG